VLSRLKRNVQRVSKNAKKHNFRQSMTLDISESTDRIHVKLCQLLQFDTRNPTSMLERRSFETIDYTVGGI
jgi:hypothetical protein